MSADLEFNKERGTVSFAYNKREGLPWHQTGTGVDGAMTSAEAIKLANLDYEVRKDKVAVIFPPEMNAPARYVPDTYATYRADTRHIFGIVSDRYEIIQNVDAFNFIDSIVGESKAVFETAGALRGGEQIFISAKLPYYIKINGHDTIENYLVISNGHDGKTSLNIFLTPVRVVCANTLSYGLSNNKFNFAFRHTTGINSKIDDAKKILDISKTISEEQGELYKYLASKAIKDVEAVDYFNQVLLTSEELGDLAANRINVQQSGIISSRKKNIVKAVNKYYVAGVGQESIVGTAFGAFNAINGYLSNIKSYTNGDRKMESLVMGGADYKLNNKALNIITSMF
jgi:phage/plasmid-like protein (TIGR03299 family)